MRFVSVADALGGDVAVGSEIGVQGWVRTRRTSKGGFSFVAVNDGSCFGDLQVVAPGEMDGYEAVTELGPGCAVRFEGELVASQGKGQSVELQARSVEVLGEVDDPETYPIAKKRHTFEYLRTVAHLRPRTHTFGAIGAKFTASLDRKPRPDRDQHGVIAAARAQTLGRADDRGVATGIAFAGCKRSTELA